MTVTAQPYGRDVSCVRRVQYGRVVSGARLLAEACYRRLITDRGQLLDDPNYGFSLSRYLNRALTKAEEAALPGLIRLELMKDARVESVSVLVRMTRQSNGALQAVVHIEVVGVETGPFPLVVSADSVTTQLLQLPEAA